MKNSFFENLKTKFGLQKQLILITISTIILSFTSLAFILPNLLTPFYEENLFVTLNQSLQFVQSDFNINNSETIIIVKESSKYFASENFSSVFRTDDVSKIEAKLTSQSGKFSHYAKSYYYVKYTHDNGYKVAIQDDSYITNQKNRLTLIIIPTLGFTLLIVVALTILYSNYLVKKISIINNKIKNIINKKYNHEETFELDDELNSLIKSIEKMRIDVVEKEEYKSQMFQSISHDLKTPIAVISSYVEAATDKVVSNKKALSVIKDEAINLNKKVELILQLNKVNYLSDKKDSNIKDDIDLNPLINSLVERYKIIRPDVVFDIKLNNKKKYRGSEEIWATIIDNILNNFVRYADKKIEIIADKKSIKFYNDGEAIEQGLLDEIFDEYKKGKKGNFGLGLSIVKKSLELFGYRIKVINEKKGVSFIIE